MSSKQHIGVREAPTHTRRKNLLILAEEFGITMPGSTHAAGSCAGKKQDQELSPLLFTTARN